MVDPCVRELLDNSVDHRLKAARTLVKIALNIENNPQKPQYRKIRLSNTIICDTLLSTSGGLSSLFAMGFIEDGEFLTLPDDASLLQLKRIRAQIESTIIGVEAGHALSLNSQVGELSVGSGPVADAASAAVAAPHQFTGKRWQLPQLPANIEILEQTFYAKIRADFDHVLIYEDPKLQEKAKSLVPVERLQQQTSKQRSGAGSEETNSYDARDLFLMELMRWFREDFFRWMNSPECEQCSGQTKHAGMGSPTADDLRWGASRVECYRCSTCGHTMRFPRYNHPGKLLETRTGRCGEWANCFTLLCRALGYEARHVLDWTDHVWTEVFSVSQNRWLHCDPGELAFDQPLLYENGWGKKLTYVIAASKDDINDVTWRYSSKHEELLLRRTECREEWLVKTMERLREERQRNMSAAVRMFHQIRLVYEFAEFITTKKRISAGENVGRKTGSEEWRIARGELNVNSLTPHYVFKPSPSETAAKCMAIKYSCAANKYTREDGEDPLSGWETGAYESHGICRKIEIDWNMAYLARTSNSAESTISWRVECPDAPVANVQIDQIWTAFHSGKVEIKVSDGSKEVKYTGGPVPDMSVFRGAHALTLEATLSGGDGDSAWQHTQLFRQSRNSSEDILVIKVFLL